MKPHEQTTFEEERRTGIGGSDVHHLFNLEPWGCRRRLWYEKRGQGPDFPVVLNAAMKRGTRLEDVAVEEYQSHTGRKTRRMSMRRHKTHPWLIVHADRSVRAEGQSRPGVLEVKVPGYHEFQRVKEEGMRDSYILQLQHGCLVTGRPWGSFAVFHADSWSLLHWDSERDDSLCKEIVAVASDFWRQVENGPAPERLDPDDGRCHSCPFRTSCQGDALLAAAKPPANGSKYEPAPELDDLANEYLEVKRLASEADELFEAAKAKLGSAIGDRTSVAAAGRRFSFKPQERFWVDKRALAEAEPKIAEKFMRRSVSRPLRDYAL